MRTQIRDLVADALYQTSAYQLPSVCERFGLEPGESSEAFSGKIRYVMNRLDPLSHEKVIEIAKDVVQDFPHERLQRALEEIERNDEQPPDKIISEILSSFDESGVHNAWKKALERRELDPEGAITAARTLLETVCKHIIESAGEAYGKSDDLVKLYATMAECIKLAPSQHTEKIFKSILGNCQSVVGNLAAIRNRLGDAHGQGKLQVKPQARHAELAVNLAGSMAMFLVSTWNARNTQPSSESMESSPC